MKDIIMKWIFSIVLVLLTWSLVVALQAIHVPDPVDDEPPQMEKNNQQNATFFLSVIPVQEPIRDDATSQPSAPPNNNHWNDKSQSVPAAETNGGNVKPTREDADEGEEELDAGDSGGGGGRRGGPADQKPSHDHFSGLVVNNQQRPKSFMPPPMVMVTNKQEVPVAGFNREESNSSTLRSITASSSLIVDNGGQQQQQQLHHHHSHHPPQRESEFRGGKEFVASPQLGQWSDEHDFKRLLTENDNVFYPIRAPQQPPSSALSQPASIKSTSFIGSDSPSDYEKSKFINELPAPKFHSSSGSNGATGGALNHLSSASLPALNKHYPKFTDFAKIHGGGAIEIPHYVQREEQAKVPFRFPEQNHRTTQFENPNHHTQWNAANDEANRPDIRVQPLHSTSPTLPVTSIGGNSEGRHSGHRSIANYINSPAQQQQQPDHPYTFDFGHGEHESPTFSKGDLHNLQQFHQKPLEFYDLNEYEKFTGGVEQPHHHYHLPPLPPKIHLQQHHGPRHGPGPWKKIVHVLAAAIPLGLVISALTPHVVYVNPNDTSINYVKQHPLMQKPYPKPPLPHPAFVTYYPRWRSLVENAAAGSSTTGDANLDAFGKDNATLTEFLTQLSNSLTDIPGVDLCEDRAFCEMARMGKTEGAAAPHKLLWTIANETTEGQIRKPGMRHIFRAIKEGRCEKIKCKKT